jgi:hypothetical protein
VIVAMTIHGARQDVQHFKWGSTTAAGTLRVVRDEYTACSRKTRRRRTHRHPIHLPCVRQGTTEDSRSRFLSRGREELFVDTMPDSVVADDVRDFILARIDSVAQIEALLLIWSNPRAQFGAADVASRLYIGRAKTEEALNGLCASSLLTRRDESYLLDGIPVATLTMIDRLLHSYARHLIPVTNIVHSKPGYPGTSILSRGKKEA